MSQLNQEALRYIRYLSFKLSCAEEQARLGWRLDYQRAVRNYDELEKLQKEKVEQLREVMPKVAKYTTYNKPKTIYRKDGTLSSHGERWFERLKEAGLKPTHTGPVQLVTSYEEPNPNSSIQVKAWLESLGWKPTTFDFKKDKDTGEERMIPQVRDGDELCSSVKKLVEQEPAIEVLDGLTVINHRLGVFKGFIQSATRKYPCNICGKDLGDMATGECPKGGIPGDPEYWLKTEVAGFTNTLRFRHKKPLTNLPGVDAPWGSEIRGCLIAPEGEFVVGSDMSSLESTTKRHYMFPYDPDYVEEMSQPGFDEHLDLAKFAGAVTEEDVELYKQDKKPELKPIRKAYKATNYSAIYGVGPPKLARTLDITEKEAKSLLKSYWQRNWSVKKLAEDQYVKTLKDGSMWLKNPVSGFYYSLRNEKDRFSTLNQGTGVYCFDQWVAHMRKLGVQVCGQFHDEVVITTDNPQEVEQKLHEAIKLTNEKLQLNVPLGIDVQVGDTYADAH